MGRWQAQPTGGASTCAAIFSRLCKEAFERGCGRYRGDRRRGLGRGGKARRDLEISPIGLQRSTKRAHGELRALRREIARLHAIDRAVEADARGQIAQPNWAPQRLTAIKNPRGLLPLNRNLSVPGFDQGSGKSSERTIELRALSGYAVLMTAKITHCHARRATALDRKSSAAGLAVKICRLVLKKLESTLSGHRGSLAQTGS